MLVIAHLQDVAPNWATRFFDICRLAFQKTANNSLKNKEMIMTFFSTPMARQFVGFDTLFEELNAFADRKEPNYPAYNIAKDDDEHYRIEVALAGFSSRRD